MWNYNRIVLLKASVQKTNAPNYALWNTYQKTVCKVYNDFLKHYEERPLISTVLRYCPDNQRVSVPFRSSLSPEKARVQKTNAPNYALRSTYQKVVWIFKIDTLTKSLKELFKKTNCYPWVIIIITTAK